MTFLVFMLIFSAFVLFISLRVLSQNKKTFEQRMELHEVVFDKSKENWMYNYKPLLASFEKVSYDRHLWSLVFFRDPYKLYDANLMEALESYEKP